MTSHARLVRPRPGSPGASAWSGLAMLALVLLSWLSAPAAAAALPAGLQCQQGMQALDLRPGEDRGQPAADLGQGLRSSRLRRDTAAAPALPQPPAAHVAASSLNPLQAQPCLDLSSATALPGTPPRLRDPGLRSPRAQAPPLA
ncbi:hypothetical protein [Solimonas sp. SE-A11]|uniref:hypothetical protein n=1 Tax=Solimonas sp. SE-A11 TaxID=3054954 RepID=UPI00259C9622|nr:hypothetical protein [Solimonas sp. SE-A11]MDM4771893.1 hypothetical protein [Solimonas sp. SE-A11]